MPPRRSTRSSSRQPDEEVRTEKKSGTKVHHHRTADEEVMESADYATRHGLIHGEEGSYADRHNLIHAHDHDDARKSRGKKVTPSSRRHRGSHGDGGEFFATTEEESSSDSEEPSRKSSSRRKSSGVKSSGRKKAAHSSSENRAHRDSGVYAADGCDDHQHSHSAGSLGHHSHERQWENPDILMTRANSVSLPGTTAASTGNVTEAVVFEYIFDVCPFLLRGPGVDALISAAGALGLADAESKLQHIKAKYANRSWQFPFWLLYVFLFLSLFFVAPIFIRWVGSGNLTFPATSASGGITQLEVNMITKEIMQLVKEDLNRMTRATTNDIFTQVNDIVKSLDTSQKNHLSEAAEALKSQLKAVDESRSSTFTASLQTLTVAQDAKLSSQKEAIMAHLKELIATMDVKVASESKHLKAYLIEYVDSLVKKTDAENDADLNSYKDFVTRYVSSTLEQYDAEQDKMVDTLLQEHKATNDAALKHALTNHKTSQTAELTAHLEALRNALDSAVSVRLQEYDAQQDAEMASAMKRHDEAQDAELAAAIRSYDVIQDAELVGAIKNYDKVQDAEMAEKLKAYNGEKDTQVTRTLSEHASKHDSLVKDVEGLRSDLLQKIEGSKSPVTADSTLGRMIMEFVDRAIDIHNADRTGRIDFAVKAAGGRIIAASRTETGKPASNANFISWIGSVLPYGRNGRSVDAVLDPNTKLGQCWPMDGTRGFVIIQLSKPIYVSHVSLEHVHYSMAVDPTTAPRNFELTGMTQADVAAFMKDDSAAKGTALGKFAYKLGAKTVQTFPTTPVRSLFPYARVDFTSNYGNADYTCIYRIRIHGNVQPPQ